MNVIIFQFNLNIIIKLKLIYSEDFVFLFFTRFVNRILYALFFFLFSKNKRIVELNLVVFFLNIYLLVLLKTF